MKRTSTLNIQNNEENNDKNNSIMKNLSKKKSVVNNLNNKNITRKSLYSNDFNVIMEEKVEDNEDLPSKNYLSESKTDKVNKSINNSSLILKKPNKFEVEDNYSEPINIVTTFPFRKKFSNNCDNDNNFITKNKSLDISIASSINSQKKITDGNTVRSNENNNQGNVNSSFQKLQISNAENFNIQLKCYINFYFILNLLNKKTRIKI